MCPVHSKWGYTSSTHRTPWLLHTFISFLSWFSYTLHFYMDYRSQSTWLLFLLKWSIILSRHFNNVEKTDIVTDIAMISTALCSFVQIQIFLPLNRFLSHFLQCCSIGETLGGHKQTFYTLGPTRKEQWPQKIMTQTCPWVSRSLWWGMGWWWPTAGSGELSAAVHAWDLLKEVTIIFITSSIIWPQVKQ